MAWPKDVRKSDLRIEYMRGSGAGGQNRNKRDTACRITHLPTGIAVRCEEERTRDKNQRRAFRRLAEKLVPLMKHALSPEQEQHKIDAQFGSNHRRTYHFPRSEVRDDITGKRAPLKRVLNGELELLR